MPERKRDGTPLPDVIYPPETMQVTLCIPKNRSYLSSFFGALWQLTYWNYWENNGTDDGAKVAAVWREHWYSWDRELNDIECEDDMGKCCTEPIKESRLNPDTGRPEVRYDGGAWQPDPSDPQFAVFAQPPIVGGGSSSTKCDAASNALQHFTDVVNATSSNIATASSVYTFAVAIVTVLLEVAIIIITGGLGSPIALTIVGMIWGAGSAVFTAGQAAFDDYWSTDNLDIVFCALYCNIGENGQFTEDQYQAWRTQVNFELPSSPARDLVMTTVNAAGAVGLSNMASYGGSADSDCSECGCDEPTFDIYAGMYGGAATLRTPDYGSHYDLVAVPDPSRPSPQIYVMYIYRDNPSCGVCVSPAELAVPFGIETAGYFDASCAPVGGIPSLGTSVYGLYFEWDREFTIGFTPQDCP